MSLASVRGTVEGQNNRRSVKILFLKNMCGRRRLVGLRHRLGRDRKGHPNKMVIKKVYRALCSFRKMISAEIAIHFSNFYLYLSFTA